MVVGRGGGRYLAEETKECFAAFGNQKMVRNSKSRVALYRVISVLLKAAVGAATRNAFFVRVCLQMRSLLHCYSKGRAELIRRERGP